MSKFIADCEQCKFNTGVQGFPICEYEEIDERNNFVNVTTKELDTMYTDECVRFIKKK